MRNVEKYYIKIVMSRAASFPRIEKIGRKI